MNNQHPNWLLEGFHPISTVAVAYFPDLQANSSAIRRFRSEIQKHPRLARELAEAEYHPHTLMLSPRQISIIIRHWGMPDEAGLLITRNPELRGLCSIVTGNSTDIFIYLFLLVFIIWPT